VFLIAWACVKVVCRALGGGSFLTQMRSLMILKPRLCNAKPELKIMWCVLETHSVPSGLKTRRASPSHRTLNS